MKDITIILMINYFNNILQFWLLMNDSIFQLF